MKNIRVFVSENFQFLVVKFSIYLNRRVFVMDILFVAKNVRNKSGNMHIVGIDEILMSLQSTNDIKGPCTS